MAEKVLVMFSGGLDSRLVLKMMQEQGLEVVALFFSLPFGTGCCDKGCSFNFTQKEGMNLKVVDCTQGKLLQEYLEVIREARHGRGSGINPCVDCRLFLFTKAREIADEMNIETIVSGEVLGERPMSQMKKSLNIIEEKTGLKGRLLRPLSAKLLDETNIEKKGIVDREKLEGIQGRRRERQMQLAEKYKITYPTPAGGCRLCEKELIRRFEYLFARGLDDHEIRLVDLGRHFEIDGCWVVIGRKEEENHVIQFAGKSKGKLIVPDKDLGFIGPTAIIVDEIKEKGTQKKVEDLLRAYSKEGSLEEREKFEEYKL